MFRFPRSSSDKKGFQREYSESQLTVLLYHIQRRKVLKCCVECNVSFLKLFVKVRSDWRNRDVLLRSYGYR